MAPHHPRISLDIFSVPSQGSVLYEALLSSFFSVNRVVINFFRLIGKYFEKDSPFDKTVTTTIV